MFKDRRHEKNGKLQQFEAIKSDKGEKDKTPLAG